MDSSDLNAILNAVPLPLVTITLDERIGAMNASASAMFGDNLSGRHYLTVLRQPALLAAIEYVFSERRKAETHYVGRDGEQEVCWEILCGPLTDNGVFSGVLVSYTDVSALQTANQMRRDFVANVSHELRTPLTALSGFIETLRGAAKDDPSARDRFLGIMENEAGRMNRLVGDLLSLSKVEGDERMRPTDRVDIAAVLRSVVQVLKPLAEDLGCSLALNLPETCDMVLGDQDQLQQVFTNLIENALKYGGREKSVTVSAETVSWDKSLRDAGVKIRVQDRGEGIAAEHIPRLTERFYRVDGHRSREMGGTGLGLAIVKHIISRHRGHLRITSAIGEGSCFTVTLRRKDADPVSDISD